MTDKKAISGYPNLDAFLDMMVSLRANQIMNIGGQCIKCNALMSRDDVVVPTHIKIIYKKATLIIAIDFDEYPDKKGMDNTIILTAHASIGKKDYLPRTHKIKHRPPFDCEGDLNIYDKDAVKAADWIMGIMQELTPCDWVQQQIYTDREKK